MFFNERSRHTFRLQLVPGRARRGARRPACSWRRLRGEEQLLSGIVSITGRAHANGHIAANNCMTIGAMASAADLGPKVSEDVSVVGFDDITLASCVRPELTTVSVTGNKRGKAAPRLVLRPLAGKDCLRTTWLLSTSLVVRKSTGFSPDPEQLDETKAVRGWSGS
jgi:DNA-binding LacI/PurR family transcriptional regulator